MRIKDGLICNTEQLSQYIEENRFDAIVVGSDQVWNPNMNGRDVSFYFGFSTSAKKLSYAASFGVSQLSDADRKMIEPFLDDFNFLSVRETTGRELLESIHPGILSDIVVDPVFLQTTAFWEEFAGERIIRQPYVLCYVMPGDSSVEKKISEMAKSYCKQTKARVIYVGRKEYKRFLPDGKDFVSASPKEFVNFIRYADFVITNSFHGTAFSLIFSKQFYSLTNGNKDAKKQYGSRITDLLDRLMLQNRVIGTDMRPDFFQNVDYRAAKSVLDEWIDHSKRIFEHAFGKDSSVSTERL